MSQEKVRVTVGMSPPILLVDYSHSDTLNGTAVVRVEAPLSMKGHAPIDLVTLINISHSKGSSPTTGALSGLADQLQNALKFIIRQLGDDDRLAIVAFNDQVVKGHTTSLSELSGISCRMALEKKVDGLVAKGETTAYKPSLEYAVKLLDDRADQKRAGFIVLISDGSDSKFKWNDASIAATDPIRSVLHKYPVHAFGLGKPHDATALHYIAKTSYGTYSSVGDRSKIMEALAVTLAGLKTVVAVDVCVNIWSGSLQITRIDTGGYTRRAGGSSNSVVIGALYAGEVKDLIVYFSYRTGWWSRGYHTTLNGVAAGATYRDAPGRQTTSTDTFSTSIPIHVSDSSSPPANPCPPYPVVLQQVVRFKVLDLLTSLVKEFLTLKEEAGGAVHGNKEGDDPVLQAIAASMLQKKWKEFKQSDESWKDAPRRFLNLGGIDRDISAMVDILNHGGLGLGCIYSWMSSYQMQRATTATGLPPVAPASGSFRTPAMEAMVQEAHRQLAEEASAQDAGASMVVCKRAVELLDIINKRFELWHKLDHDLPSSHQHQQQEEGDDGEARDLSAALRGDISRARQHDIYLASDQAIKQWRIFLTSVEKKRGHELDK
ncbi:hypothetical protein BS78_K152000 [Paspalum vaginatum]|uniref:VWFA domain-containing protein n=1 Tax=Paspalum vaginatum TaxID=158149 RepID=A0A9W7X8G8_9POAL|nr:hypothetical protein BS78_K152000 [Paspalum vaginatum]